MIFEARQQGWKVVDASSAITIVHQDHDYAHLPQGQAHYRLPETAENVRLAGGERAIFNLLDADYQLVDGQLRPFPLRGAKLWREVEIFPLVRLHSKALEPFLRHLPPAKGLRSGAGLVVKETACLALRQDSHSMKE